MKKEVYENVPDSEVKQIEEDCRSAGATEVITERQADGTYKVTCTYRDDPASTQ